MDFQIRLTESFGLLEKVFHIYSFDILSLLSHFLWSGGVDFLRCWCLRRITAVFCFRANEMDDSVITKNFAAMQFFETWVLGRCIAPIPFCALAGLCWSRIYFKLRLVLLCLLLHIIIVLTDYGSSFELSVSTNIYTSWMRTVLRMTAEVLFTGYVSALVVGSVFSLLVQTFKVTYYLPTSCDITDN